MTDVQWASGVGADKFNLDFLSLACTGEAIFRALGRNVVEHLVPAYGCQGKVNETGTGNVNLVEERACTEGRHQSLGDLAGRLLLGPGHDHCQVGRKITMLWVSGHFDLDLRDFPGVQGLVIEAGLQGLADLLSQEILHKLTSTILRNDIILLSLVFAQGNIFAVIWTVQGSVTVHRKAFRTIGAPSAVHTELASVFCHDYDSSKG